MNSTGDLRWLIIDDQPQKIETFDVTILDAVWMDMQQQYIDEFGMSDEYKTSMRERKYIALKQLKYIQTGDGSQLMLAEIKEREIEEYSKSVEKVNFTELIVATEKFLKFAINGDTISVLKLHTYLKLMNKQASKGNG